MGFIPTPGSPREGNTDSDGRNVCCSPVVSGDRLFIHEKKKKVRKEKVFEYVLCSLCLRHCEQDKASINSRVYRPLSWNRHKNKVNVSGGENSMKESKSV